jgi:DNA helicase-2/ATP-dependent DNA helicase PcrA
VDEYQDTNMVQYIIVRALSIDHRNLSVTGDPDQSIYGWRGANINNILDFEKDFPDTTIIRLEQNYRSTPQILTVADSLIVHNVLRKEKKLITGNPPGMPVRLTRCGDQKEEAESIAQEIADELQRGHRKASDYAICYRMNALSRNFEHALRSRKIPFQLVRGLEFFKRKEIKDVLAYLRVIFNPSDTVSLERIINEPPRGIGKTTMQKLSDRAAQLGLPTMEVMRDIANFSNVTAKTKKAITQFVQMMDRLSEMSAQEYPVASLIEAVLRDSGYRKHLMQSESEEDQERLENIEELLTVAHEFDEREADGRFVTADGRRQTAEKRRKGDAVMSSSDSENTGDAVVSSLPPSAVRRLPSAQQQSSLEEFLEQAALVSDVDALDQDVDRVSLMTMHAAKGLEFPVVYIVAIEESILPHDRSTHEPMQLEEERRLFFVGITRAEEALRLSRAERRDFRGSFGMTAISSRFLFELPNDANMVRYDSPDDFLNGEDYGGGKRLVREKIVEYDEYDDVDVDVDYDELPPKKKKEKKEQKRYSMMTGSELLQKKKKQR